VTYIEEKNTAELLRNEITNNQREKKKRGKYRQRSKKGKKRKDKKKLQCDSNLHHSDL